MIRMHALRVVSFNVWSDAPRNLRWATRKDRLIAALKACAPDVAGLQEPTAAMLADLHAGMPGFDWVGCGRDDGQSAGEFNPIFFRADRFELLASSTFWLALDGVSPVRGWDALCRRIVTWAHLKFRDSERDFFHFNTHFDHFGRRARRRSARLLLENIERIAGTHPVVVTGDLNSRESSEVYRTLIGRIPFSPEHPGLALRDAYHDAELPREGPRRTFLGLLGRFGLGRIDYIFVGPGVRTHKYAVLPNHGGASDHLPVQAEVRIP